MTALHQILHVSPINVLFYLTFDIKLNIDVIYQPKIFGLKQCDDSGLKASGEEEVGLFLAFMGCQ